MVKYNSYPEKFGIFSFAMIFNTLLTCYIMIFYAKEYIVRAYDNFKTYRATNMETLIALGSTSAFLLFVFYLVRSIISTSADQRE
jgi:cation transport ATPase